jgi:N6-adenosine-specific RNA methylase IME4
MLKIDDEFKSLIPPLTTEEFEQLEKNILAEGIREPIIVWSGYDIIIDGHNRYEIAQRHNLKYTTFGMGFDTRDEVIDWMINNQLGRRNLTRETMSYLRGLQYEREKKKVGEHKGNQHSNLEKPQNEVIPTAEKLAEQHKVSKATIERDAAFTKAVDTIVSNTTPEVKNKILNREVNITKEQIQQVAKQEPNKQKAIIEKLVSKEAKSVVDANRLIKKDEVHEIPQLQGKYRVIYTDPPWSYNDKRDGNTTGATDHYPTMALEEICKLPIKELAEDNAVLFLWTTSPLLEDTFKVVSAWGFKYKTSFIWDKVKHNMGHYNSVRHEFLLICTRGSCTPDNVKLFDSVQTIERSAKHSEKPEEFRNIIDTLYTAGEKIELFSRKKVDGWQVWGNQT